MSGEFSVYDPPSYERYLSGYQEKDLNGAHPLVTSAMLVQCSISRGYHANWELVVIWVDNEPGHDGCISMLMMRIREIYVFEVTVRIET